MPPRLRGCRAAENANPAAGFAADGAADTDGHGHPKSCRIAGDSPHRLWLRGPGSLKKDFAEKRMASDSLIHYSIVIPFFNKQENDPHLDMMLTEAMNGIG